MSGQSSTTGAAQASTSSTISYADGCAVNESCACTPLTGGVFNRSSGLSVDVSVDLGSPPTVTPLSVPSWVVAVPDGNTIKITGDAPVAGDYTLVYEVSNECSRECLVVSLKIEEVCPPSNNIISDIGYKDADFSVDFEFAVPSGSTIVSSQGLDGLGVHVYGSTFTASGTIKQPIASTYSVSLNGPCGPMTISGNIVACNALIIDSVQGSSQLEKGVNADMSWIISGTGPIAITSALGLPAGTSASVIQNVPVGKATLKVTGSLTDDPCPQTASSCEIQISVRGQCGNLTVKRKYSQHPCRALRIIGDVGTDIVLGDPSKVCRVVEGYGPPDIVDFESIPLGMEVTISAFLDGNGDPVANRWLVCMEGTPITDPCKEYTDNLCDCAKANIVNECGKLEVPLCYSLDSIMPRPKYCVGMAIMTPLNAVDAALNCPIGHGGWEIVILGVAPNSDVRLVQYTYGEDIQTGQIPGSPPSSIIATIATDNIGYAKYTFCVPNLSSTYNYPIVWRLEHDTCAIATNRPDVFNWNFVDTGSSGGGNPI